MTIDCEALATALRECIASLSWDHFYDEDSECGACLALTKACRALGINKEEAEALR